MNTAEFQNAYGFNPDYINPDGDVIDTDELTNLYNDMLNESGPIILGGHLYGHAEILKAVDPIAYRCGMLDFRESLEWDEWYEDHVWIEVEDED